MKLCSRCKTEKELTEFHRHSRTKDGLNCQCRACAIENAYLRYQAKKEEIAIKGKEYRLKNKEAISERRRNRVKDEAFREKAKERYAKWLANNDKQKEALRLKAYREANREKVRERSRLWARENAESGKKWKLANPEKRKEAARKYMRLNSARLNAVKKKAQAPWANTFFIEETYSLAALRRELSGFSWHVDHIVPLHGKVAGVHVVCGLHTEANLRVIPGVENARKGNRYWPDMP